MTADAPLMWELREYMRSTANATMRSWARALEREAWLAKQNAAGRQNYSGDLNTVINKDLLLNDHIGAAKTNAAMSAAMAAVIQAEIAYEEKYGEDLHLRAGSVGWEGRT
jgi:hypothetical protein